MRGEFEKREKDDIIVAEEVYCSIFVDLIIRVSMGWAEMEEIKEVLDGLGALIVSLHNFRFDLYIFSLLFVLNDWATGPGLF